MLRIAFQPFRARSACLLAAVLSFSPAFAGEVKIVATQLDGVIETNGSGVYDKILKELKVKYDVLPAARALESFKNKKHACVFPLDQRFQDDADTVQSVPINLAKIFIFTLSGDPITDLDKLKGQSVGMRNGLNYGKKLANPKFNVSHVASIDQNVQKLRDKRIAAIVDFTPDMEDYMKEKSVKLVYDEKHPVDVHEDAVLCHAGADEKEFIKNFSKLVKDNAAAINKALGK